MFEIWKTVITERYAKFDGRASRAEFWWFYLANMLVSIGLVILMFVGFAIADILGFLVAIAVFAYSLAVIVPQIAVSIRRLHDSGKSGWWLLISFIPFGGIVILVFWIMEGTNGPNDYGAAAEPVPT